MLERGDWVVPTFNYELRTQKPVLLYWLIMMSYSLFGVNEFSARLPSALLAVGTTLVTFQLGRRLFSDRAGLLAGLIMASCLMFGVAGRAATPDSCLIFFTSLSFLAYVVAVTRQSDGRCVWQREDPAMEESRLGASFIPARWNDFALIYGLMALAVLAKGPIGVILPTAIMGLFLLLVNAEHRHDAKRWIDRYTGFIRQFATTAWSMRPFTLVLTVVAVAGPWYAMVGLRTDGRWLQSFFGTENLARFQTAMEGHSGSIVYYPVAVLIGFFPWSIVLPAAIWVSLHDCMRDTVATLLFYF